MAPRMHKHAINPTNEKDKRKTGGEIKTQERGEHRKQKGVRKRVKRG